MNRSERHTKSSGTGTYIRCTRKWTRVEKQETLKTKTFIITLFLLRLPHHHPIGPFCQSQPTLNATSKKKKETFFVTSTTNDDAYHHHHDDQQEHYREFSKLFLYTLTTSVSMKP